VGVGDLTYLRSAKGFMFLALLTDKMSRHIVGYHCGESLESLGCQQALEMALQQLGPGEQPIHHSDRGSQYCCHAYVQRASAAGLTMSMTELEHCAENALAERMNGMLKSEYGLDQCFKTKAQLRQAVHQAIHLYGIAGHTRRWPTGFRRRCIRVSSPWHPPPAGCPATGPQAHDLSRALRFEDRLMSALPQCPTSPSSRFADRKRW
jgi:transposase InsO family protein